MSNNPKIRLKITECNGIIKIKIISMDERFRSPHERCYKRFTASNRFIIYSYERPSIHSAAIYLCGCQNQQDTMTFSLYTYSPKELIKKIRVAFREWAESDCWETGWPILSI